MSWPAAQISEATPAPYTLGPFHAIAWVMMAMTHCGCGDLVRGDIDGEGEDIGAGGGGGHGHPDDRK